MLGFLVLRGFGMVVASGARINRQIVLLQVADRPLAVTKLEYTWLRFSQYLMHGASCCYWIRATYDGLVQCHVHACVGNEGGAVAVSRAMLMVCCKAMA